MLYPRVTEKGKLVADDQVVGVREHLSRRNRIIFLSGQIGEAEVLNGFLALDSLSNEPIKLVITSGGGDLDIAFLLYDTINLIRSPVWTFGRYCASAACLLLAVGQKRYLSPHAKVMLHLPSGQAMGDARDWEIQHAEMQKYKNKMVDVLIECGVQKERESILKDIDRDKWFEPEEAIAYGLADKVMNKETMGEWLK